MFSGTPAFSSDLFTDRWRDVHPQGTRCDHWWLWVHTHLSPCQYQCLFLVSQDHVGKSVPLLKREMSCHCLINNSDYRVLTIPVQMLSQEQWVSHWKGVAALLALPLGSQQWTQPEGTDNRVHRTHRPLPALHHGTWLSHFPENRGWWPWVVCAAQPQVPLSCW